MSASLFRRTFNAIYTGATWAASFVGSFIGSYASLDPNRKDILQKARPRPLTANQLLGPTLGALSAQCRYIERITPLGRAVCEGLVADVVGTGIGLRPNSGDAMRDLALWDEFELWAETALVDGRSLYQWQAVVAREMGTSGAGLARWIWMPERARDGRLPWALLPLEVEWFSIEPLQPIPAGNCFVRGKEVDILGRPVRYHLRHPEDTTGKGEVVPADQIQHVYELRRPGQLHGEPMLAVAVERALQDARLVETELRAAVATAAPAIAITSELAPNHDNDDDDGGPPQEQVTDIPAGATVHLLPGEKAECLENHRPAQGIAPFRETLTGDVAASCRVSKAWLTRDPSKANYSSMRMDQLLSKRITAPLKDIIGEGTAGDSYKKLFPWMLLKRGFKLISDPAQLQQAKRYTLKPDQPEYVDPQKDVAASCAAIANNLSTYDIELSARGKDWMEVFRQRAREDQALVDLGLPLIQPVKQPAGTADTDPEENGDKEDAEDDVLKSKKMARLTGVA